MAENPTTGIWLCRWLNVQTQWSATTWDVPFIRHLVTEMSELNGGF